MQGAEWLQEFDGSISTVIGSYFFSDKNFSIVFRYIFFIRGLNILLKIIYYF